MPLFIRILFTTRFWIVVFGCIFLGLVLGDFAPMIWVFQEPTYLLEKGTTGLTKYMCDPAKTECKINFDFTPNLPTEESAESYACLIDFGFGATSEDNKCNPETVIFPAGEHRVHLIITHIASSAVVQEGNIEISNILAPPPTTGGDDTGGDVVISPAYTVGISWQSFTQLLLKDDLTLSEYTCNSEAGSCQINLLVTPQKNGLEDSQLTCALIADFELLPSTSDPCNPLQSVVPAGDHTVTIQILRKTDSSVVATRTIILKNPPVDTSISPLRVTSAFVWQSPTDLLAKEDTSLTEYACNPGLTNCRINLLFTPLLDGAESSLLTCEITSDFPLAGTNDPCNPNTSTIPTGDHILTMKILQKSDTTVLTTREIILKNPLVDTSIDPLRVTSTLAWQSPTYLLGKEDTSISEYTCTSDQTECKINLQVTPFLDGVTSSRLICEITSDFPLETTIDPCNPNTSIVPIGDHTVTIKILNKSDNSPLTTREIILKNPPIDISIDPLRISSVLTWQSPTYLLSKEDTSLAEYACDVSQSDCKMNLLFKPLLDGGESPKLTCEITSDFPLEPTSDPCNPNTSLVPVGDHKVLFKILQKSDNSVLVTREILIKNPVRATGGGSSGGGSEGASLLDLSTVKMLIQSGLDFDGRCRSDICQVNFLAEVPVNAVCHWDFGTGVFETVGTDTRCNPGYVKFPFVTQVTLTVSDQNYPTNTVQKTLTVSRTTSIETPFSPVARIDTQGVLGKNKRLTSEGITCAIGNDEACSINLTGESSLNAKTFFWNLGNGHTSEKENPGAEKYPLGRHRVILRVMNVPGALSEAYYIIDVVKKFDVLPEKECLDCDRMRGEIQISAVLPNPPHADTVEWIEIKNISSEQWDLSACTLSDMTKSFLLSEKIAAGKTIRLRQSTTDLSLGNSKEILELRCGEFLIDSFSWNFAIPSGYILRRSMLDSRPTQVSVVSVIDGDTIDVMLNSKKTRIRLLGVDTPETVHPRKEVEKFGKEASDFTKKILTGETVWINYDHEPIDHYGRTLGYIWQCDAGFDTEKCQLFNARLITEGYARMERRFQFMYYDSFDTLEKEAKKIKVGIWSDSVLAGILNDLSVEEKELLTLEQEEEYLRLQKELLELAKKKCEEEGICEENISWTEITNQMTILSVRSFVSGILKISGRTWGDFPVKISIFLGEKEMYSMNIRTNTIGEYELEWYPKILGEYRVEIILEEQVEELLESEKGILKLEKIVNVDNISDHFLNPLAGKILVQGKMSNNRWMGTDGIFYCRSRGSCSVNLIADYNRKNTVKYEWILPSGEIFIGKNPPSIKVPYGDFFIQLVVTDEITGERFETFFGINHRAIPKAAKKTPSSKYTIDLKDATLDSGGGITPNSTPVSLKSVLLVLASLSAFSFMLFGRQKI